MVEHWYHVYAGGLWREPVAEHLWALDQAGFDGPFHVGIVGPQTARRDALDEITQIRPVESVTEAEDGWEQVTLHALHHAQHHRPGRRVVVYAHTKGAANPSTVNTMWRRSMTHQLIRRYRQATQPLTDGTADVVGCHWLTPGEYPDAPDLQPMFGGNYWAATSTYLRTLPTCATGCRHDAEWWVALNRPRIVDLTPGWPGTGVFPPAPYGRLQTRP